MPERTVGEYFGFGPPVGQELNDAVRGKNKAAGLTGKVTYSMLSMHSR